MFTVVKDLIIDPVDRLCFTILFYGLFGIERGFAMTVASFILTDGDVASVGIFVANYEV